MRLSVTSSSSSSFALASFAAPVLFVALGALAGCGGSTNNGISSPGPDGSTDQPGSDSGGGGGPTDGSVSDGSTNDDGGSLTDGGLTTDSATDADTGADAGTCGEQATRKDCITCCDTRYAGGLASFDTAVEECACQTSLCGPIDGGVDDAGASDSGDFGTGACTGTCGTAMALTGVCERCAVDSLGSAADGGPCRSAVASVCGAGTACGRYVACTDTCPAK